MNTYTFPNCGCEIEQVGVATDGMPKLKWSPELENISLECSRTWDLISAGNTKGVFQLESRLGSMLAKKLKPRNIEHLAALISIMRPGVLEAMRDKKSVTQHYIDRKNGEEPVTYYHPALKPALESTYGELCIHENTFISMADGTECKIKDIQPNQQTQSIDEDTLKLFPNDTCINVGATKNEIGLTIRLENGYDITVTKDHKLFTSDGWVEAQNLDISQHLVGSCIHQNSQTKCKQWFINDWFNNTQHSAYFIGQLVGDGCAGSAIATGTENNHHKILAWLKQNSTLVLNPYFNVRSWYIGISHPDLVNWQDLNTGNRKTKYRSWIESLGLHYTKNQKVIPKCIFITSAKNRRAFLAGLLDADGYIGQSFGGTCIIHYCSDNYEIINGIRKLLALDGIASYISPDKKHIHVKNTKQFVNLIGQYLIVKTWKNQGNLCTDTLYGTIKCQTVKDKILEHSPSIRSYFQYPRAFSKRSLNTHNNFCGQWIGGSVGLKYKNIKWMKIVSITKTKSPQQFYSISIKHNHNVIANGIIAKNCYQEQAMQIARDIAGFDLQQADVLRKAIGKKKADVMAKVKVEFIEGCKNAGVVTEEEAVEIFGWIEKSQRYSFNKSHAVAYALNAYLSAYVKAHFPRMFFTSYLYFAQQKSNPHEEVNELVNNAKLNNIDVVCPSLKYMNEHFRLLDNKIYFGFADIKGIGAAVITKIQVRVEAVEKLTKKDVKDWTWTDFLIFMTPYINRTAWVGIISSGAMDYMNEHRMKMIYEAELYSSLSKREQEWIIKYYLLNSCEVSSITKIFQAMLMTPAGRKGACANRNRQDKVKDMLELAKSPPYSTVDSPIWMACKEEELLGISLSCSIVDGCPNDANCTCKEFLDNYRPKPVVLAVKIDTISEIRTKKGKDPGKRMAFITVSDNSAQLDGVVVFPDIWKENRHLFVDGNTVLLIGNPGKKDDSSFIVEKVLQI